MTATSPSTNPMENPTPGSVGESVGKGFKPRAMWKRRALDRLVKITSGLAAAGGCAMLGWILWGVAYKGFGAINWAFFTQIPGPPGVEGGGVASAIVGTLLMTGIASVVGVPLGLLAGVFLAEFGRGTRLATAVRFCANSLMGVPSIIVGIFIYGIMVKPMGSFSGWAGAVSLLVIMLPIVARTSEDMLNLVPNSTREAALALGAPRWRVTFGVLIRAANVGILTGVLLAIARVSGETAPLLFTALNSPFWTEFGSPAKFVNSFNGPTANLTVTIFNQAMSPYEAWQQTAWAASLLITVGVLFMTVTSRLLLKLGSKRSGN